MVSITLTPKTADDIKRINMATTVCEGDIDAISGRYMVDAKSLLGLISINFADGVDIVFHEDSDKKIFEAKYESLK